MSNPISQTTTAIPLSEQIAHPRFSGRLRTLAHAAWWLIFGAIVVMNLLALPLGLQVLQRACVTSICVNQQLNVALFRAWLEMGLSPQSYAVVGTAISLFPTMIYLAVAFILFRSKPNDGVVFFSSLMLATFGGITYSGVVSALGFENSWWWLPLLALDYLGSITVIAFFYIFPNGRFVPRWTRFILGLWVIEQFLELLTNPPIGWNLVPSWIVDSSLLFAVATAVIAQFYRYRRVSNSVERRQTKWVVFGTITSLVGFVSALLIYSFAASGPLRHNIIAAMGVNLLVSVFISLIPLSIAIALLRARLWDIDLIINRTLVYSALTAILAGILAVTSDLAKRFFLALTGESSELAPILATLIIVALFEPIKKRVEGFVDRHFKYSTRGLGAFGEKLREFVELNDTSALAKRFLQETIATYGASGGAVYFGEASARRLIATLGQWDGNAALAVPLEHAGVQRGVIELSARQDSDAYDEDDQESLKQDSALVAHVLELAHHGTY